MAELYPYIDHVLLGNGNRALWEYLSTINILSDETESGKLRREMFDRYEDYFV